MFINQTKQNERNNEIMNSIFEVFFRGKKLLLWRIKLINPSSLVSVFQIFRIKHLRFH